MTSAGEGVLEGPDGLHAIPLVHGRLPFALCVRRALLQTRYDALAVELPPSLRETVLEGVERLPVISSVLYRDRPPFLDPAGTVYYVPIDPCDGIVEGLRIAVGERTPIHFVDADVPDFKDRGHVLPDPHAILGMGLRPYVEMVEPLLRRLPRTTLDQVREAHMAARLRELRARLGPSAKILFLCGLAHWLPILDHLRMGDGHPAPDQEEPAWIERRVVHPRSLPHVMGEIPWVASRWQKHRASFAVHDFDPAHGLKDLLIEAREEHRELDPDSLERATPQALRTLLIYLRKLTVPKQRLFPDTWALAQAAKGCVGNDYAVALLEVAHRYPPNEEALPSEDGGRRRPKRRRSRGATEPPRDPFLTSGAHTDLEGQQVEARPRTPGEDREMRRLKLERRPDRRRQQIWRHAWNPHTHCSWPPEDVQIERFRDYIAKRALSLAAMSLRRTEPFTTSLKDGLALRETLRDWHRGRIHVKEEPPVTGEVGAVVLIFEEDDDGTRFPWRTTWHAEHPEESTLAFYSTEPTADMVGPKIGRISYGGALFIFPPLPIPNVWDDLRFERARTPSERLLLGAIFWSRERYIVHVGERPPSREVQLQAEALHRHVVHMPLTTFSHQTLEKLRRAHVLNGQHVRSWAARFIR